jgi:hypothetical protein
VIPRDVLHAIGRAVHGVSGDMADVDDLVDVWYRLDADRRGRLDRMRAQAKAIRCCCADGGVLAADGRCERCFGRNDLEATA